LGSFHRKTSKERQKGTRKGKNMKIKGLKELQEKITSTKMFFAFLPQK
jgi:hypothetical protein